MLEWAQASPHGGLAVLVDHDDAEREFAYESTAATFQDAEPITTIGERLGWVIVSMRDDWDPIFASRDPSRRRVPDARHPTRSAHSKQSSRRSSTFSCVTSVGGTTIIDGTSGSTRSEKPSPRAIRRAMLTAEPAIVGLYR